MFLRSAQLRNSGLVVIIKSEENQSCFGCRLSTQKRFLCHWNKEPSTLSSLVCFPIATIFLSTRATTIDYVHLFTFCPDWSVTLCILLTLTKSVLVPICRYSFFHMSTQFIHVIDSNDYSYLNTFFCNFGRSNTTANISLFFILAEFGDFDPSQHTPVFVSTFRFLPDDKQTEDFEMAVLHQYNALV